MTTMFLKSMDDVLNLHREMDRVFGGCGTPGWREAATGGPATRRMHLREDPGNIYAEMAIPGVDPAKLEVTVEDGVLKITGERPNTFDEAEVLRWRLKERETGQFTQQFRLPVEIDRDKVSAEYKHGILNITLPKAPEAQPKRIEIKMG